MAHGLYNHLPYTFFTKIQLLAFYGITVLYHSHFLPPSIFQHMNVYRHAFKIIVKPFETSVSNCHAFLLLKNSVFVFRVSLFIALSGLELLANLER